MSTTMSTTLKTLLTVAVGLLSCFLCAICTSGLIIWFARSSLNQIPKNEIWRITSLETGDLLIANDKVLLYGVNSLNDLDCACVYAADKKTGKILWSTEELAKPYIAEYKRLYPDSIMRPGRVEVIGTDNEQGILYITINESSLYALSENNGEVIWGPINVLTYAFPNTKSSNLIFVLDENGYLSAFDKSNGQEIWKTANLSIIPDSRARLLTNEDMVYVSFVGNDDKNRMIAFDARNGKELWNTDIKSFSYSYNFSANYLYLIWQGYYPDKMGQILVIDPKNGQKLWNTSFPDYALDPSPPQVVDNKVYVVENKDETLSKLVARDATSGEVLWEFNKDYAEGELRYTPYDNVVYVGSETGNLYALDPQTGKEIWKSATNAFPTCMTVINDSLIVESMHNYVSSFSAQTGSQKWFQSIPVGAHTSECFEDGSTVRIRNNRLFVVDLDRILHSLDLETGQELWSWHDFRYPSWRPIPISKPIPEIAVIEDNVIYVFDSWTMAEGIFALRIE